MRFHDYGHPHMGPSMSLLVFYELCGVSVLNYWYFKAGASTDVNMYMYIYLYIYTYVHMCIYIYIKLKFCSNTGSSNQLDRYIRQYTNLYLLILIEYISILAVDWTEKHWTLLTCTIEIWNLHIYPWDTGLLFFAIIAFVNFCSFLFIFYYKDKSWFCLLIFLTLLFLELCAYKLHMYLQNPGLIRLSKAGTDRLLGTFGSTISNVYRFLCGRLLYTLLVVLQYFSTCDATLYFCNFLFSKWLIFLVYWWT